MTRTARIKSSTGAEFSLSVSRALDILSSFNAERREQGLVDISRVVSLSKGSVGRFLQALEMHGYVDRDPESRLYRPGPEVARVGSFYRSADRLRQHAAPIMRELVQSVGFTSYLSELRDDHMLILFALEGLGPIRYTIPIGSKLPIYNTATGLIAMSQVEPDELDKLIGKAVSDSKMRQGKLGRAALIKRLAEVRTNGYSTNWEMRTAGVGSVAAPILTADGKSLCVLSVGFATSQIKKEEMPSLGRQIKAAANRLSKVLAEKGIMRVE